MESEQRMKESVLESPVMTPAVTAEQMLDLFFPWGELEQGVGTSTFRRRRPNRHGMVLIEMLDGRQVLKHEGD
jgi:hypothetical protein